MLILSLFLGAVGVSEAAAGIIIGAEHAQSGRPRVTEISYGPESISWTMTEIRSDHHMWIWLTQEAWAGPLGSSPEAANFAAAIGSPGPVLTDAVLFISDFNADPLGRPEVWDAATSVSLGFLTEEITGNTITWRLPPSLLVGANTLDFSKGYQWSGLYWHTNLDGQRPWYTGVVPVTANAVPEPSTMVSFGIAGVIVGIAALRRRLRRPPS